MGIQGPHGGGGDGHHGAGSLDVGVGTNHGDAAAAVVPTLEVAPGQRRRLGTTQPCVGQHRHQGHVKLRPFLGLIGRFEAAAALAGLDGGEPDHGESVGGEGAGLPLWFGQPAPPSFQRGAHPRGPGRAIPAWPTHGPW